jgi:hypothetical protein
MKKRVRRGDPQRRQQWQAAVWQWQQSGLSVRDFCRTQGLKALYLEPTAGHQRPALLGRLIVSQVQRCRVV